MATKATLLKKLSDAKVEKHDRDDDVSVYSVHISDELVIDVEAKSTADARSKAKSWLEDENTKI